MQWASSTASNLTPTARTASRNRPLRNRSGDDVDEPELAGRHAFQPGVLLAGASVLLMKLTGSPNAWS